MAARNHFARPRIKQRLIHRRCGGHANPTRTQRAETGTRELGVDSIRCLNRLRQPLCALSLHYHPGASYAPELLASVHENPADQDAQVLSYVYRALPEGLRDVVILTLPERVAEMRKANPHAQVHPLRFALRELSIDGLRILLGLTADPAPEYAQRVEAHKFARVPLLRQQMETLVRERRHLGVSVLLSSQDPPSLPGEVLSLLDGVGVFRHESSAWARHLGKSCAAFARLPVSATARLPPGLMWFWARRWQVIRPEWEMPEGPILIATRPRASAHRG